MEPGREGQSGKPSRRSRWLELKAKIRILVLPISFSRQAAWIGTTRSSVTHSIGASSHCAELAQWLDASKLRNLIPTSISYFLSISPLRPRTGFALN